MKLNIGCGRDYKPGWINIDISHEVKAEHYLDIRTDSLSENVNPLYRVPGAPATHKTGIETGSVGLIYISGVLEQIGENEHLIHAMNECHRVLMKGGIMTVVVPNARFAIAHQDPMDVRKFTRETFSYFQKGTRQYELYGSVYGFAGWSEIRIEENDRHIMTVTMVK